MSGALAQYRTASRPTGEIKGFKHVLRPGGVHKDGRCVEWIVDYVPVFKHVLAYPPEFHRAGKHRRGRTQPMSDRTRRNRTNRKARAVQAAKTEHIDLMELGRIEEAIYAADRS